MNDTHRGKDDAEPGGAVRDEQVSNEGAADATPFRRKLAQDFQDREFRESYAEEFLRTSLASQIQAVREARGWNQKRLADEMGTSQPAVSRLEDVTYSGWTIKTLIKAAFALGTRLHITLETFSSLIEQVEAFSRGHLERPAFEEDAKIQRWAQPGGAIQKLERAGDPRLWMERAVSEWLAKEDWAEQRLQLTNWLRGYGLPPLGDGEETYVWLLYGIPLGAERPAVQEKFAELVVRLLDEEPDLHWNFEEAEDALYNLFLLVTGLDWSEKFTEQIAKVYERAVHVETRLTPRVLDALLAAMIRTQSDGRYKDLWLDMVRRGTSAVIPGDEYAGMSGLKWMPGEEAGKPDIAGLAEGLKLIAENHLNKLREGEKERVLRGLVEGIESLYGNGATLAEDIAKLSKQAPKWARLVLDKMIPLVANVDMEGGVVLKVTVDEEECYEYTAQKGGEKAEEEAARLRGQRRRVGRGPRDFRGGLQTLIGNRGRVRELSY